jgi:hypothetical protein
MATHGHGTVLAGSTAGTIGEVRKLDVSGRKRDSLDVSSCDSTSSAREFIPGMMDEGEITVEVVYDGSNVGVAFEGEITQSITIKCSGVWTYSDVSA